MFTSLKVGEISAFELDFNNPFGIAAGMDKKAEALNGWTSLGCGFIEIGGITMHKQRGNPKPRMYRDNSTRSLVNRMGFNNIGSFEMEIKLKGIMKNMASHKFQSLQT